MAKQFECKDLGMECDFTAKAKSEEELMPKIKKHGAVHGIKDITPELAAKIHEVITDV